MQIIEMQLVTTTRIRSTNRVNPNMKYILYAQKEVNTKYISILFVAAGPSPKIKGGIVTNSNRYEFYIVNTKLCVVFIRYPKHVKGYFTYKYNEFDFGTIRRYCGYPEL